MGLKGMLIIGRDAILMSLPLDGPIRYSPLHEITGNTVHTCCIHLMNATEGLPPAGTIQDSDVRLDRNGCTETPHSFSLGFIVFVTGQPSFFMRNLYLYRFMFQSILIEPYNFRMAQYVAKNPIVPVVHD